MVDGIIPDKEPAKDSGSWKVNFDNLLRGSELDKKADEKQTAKSEKTQEKVQRVADTHPATPPSPAPVRPWSARPGVAPAFVPETPQPLTPAPKTQLPPAAESIKPAVSTKPPVGGFAAPESPNPNPAKPADSTLPATDPRSQVRPDPRFPNHVDPRFQPARPQPQQPFIPERPVAQPVAQPGLVPPRANPSPFAPTPPFTQTPQFAPPQSPEIKPGVPGTTSGGEQVVPWNQYIRTQPGAPALPGLAAPGGPRPALPGLPGAQPQGDHPGINPSSQVINVSPEGRKAIEDALHDAVNVQGHLLAGGTWGAMLNTAKWGMDYNFAKGNVQWWGPYSPFMKKLEAEELRIQGVREAHAAAEAGQIMAAQKLESSTTKIASLLDFVDKKIAGASAVADPATNLLTRQHAFLKDATNLVDPTKIQAAIGTAEEVTAGSKLFVAGSTEADHLLKLSRHMSGAEVAANPAELLSKTSAMMKDAETQLAKAVVAPAGAAGLSEKGLELLKQQQAFLSDIHNLTNMNKARAAIGTAEQVALGEPVGGARKLFVTGTPEAQALLERAQQHADFYKAKASATAVEARLGKMEIDLAAMREAGAGNGWSAATKGFLTGTLVTGATIGAGYAADKWLLGGNANMNGFDRFLIDGVAIPGLLMTPGIPTRYKVGGTIALFGLARAKGYFDNSGVPALTQSSLLLRPNTVDTLGFTTAALAPLGVRGKLAIAGATLVAGRGYNLLAHAAGWDGPDGIELREQARNALNNDSNTRTSATFDRAVDASLALSRHKAGEGALDLQLADLINSQNTMSKLDYLRNHAILSTAIGMARLEKGSRIVEGGSNAVDIYGDDSRILKNFKYDFLGESMLQLAQGFTDLSDLRYALHQEKAKVDADKSLNDSTKKEKLALLDDQMKQCDSERQKVDKTLKEIFGAHDIDGIFKELSEACRNRSRDMDQIIFKRKQLFETLSPTVNPEIRAKFARDLCLAHLAEAARFSKANDGEQARIMYLAGLEFLSKAQSLDPKNPNLQKMQTIAGTIGSTIPRAITNQYNSNFNNPFQLKSGQK